MQNLLIEGCSDWVRLIRSEYSEMPGLHLSKKQAQRMWSFDARTADVIFGVLEASNFLTRTPNDLYIKANVTY